MGLIVAGRCFPWFHVVRLPWMPLPTSDITESRPPLLTTSSNPRARPTQASMAEHTVIESKPDTQVTPRGRPDAGEGAHSMGFPTTLPSDLLSVKDPCRPRSL